MGAVFEFTPYASPSDEHVQLLLRALHTYLPYSLPLYRRLQFHLSHPNPPIAQIFDSLALQEVTVPSGPRADWWLSTASKKSTPDDQTPWLAAHIDLSVGGQTAIWVFANWEVPEIGTQTTTKSTLDFRKSLLHSLFETIYHRDVSRMPEEPPETWLNLKKRAGYEDTPYSRSRLLFGTLHSAVRSMMPQEAIARVDDPYLKYIFTPECYGSSTGPANQLPPGYRFEPMKHEHLHLVCERTHIPRTVETLAKWFGLGVYHQGQAEPISWGFLGKDASLSSLHTEPEHRGKSIAVLLSRELFRQQNYHFRSASDAEQTTLDDVSYADANVSASNMQSRRVMEKIGGKVMWEVCWLELELEALVGAKGIWNLLQYGPDP